MNTSVLDIVILNEVKDLMNGRRFLPAKMCRYSLREASLRGLSRFTQNEKDTTTYALLLSPAAFAPTKGISKPDALKFSHGAFAP